MTWHVVKFQNEDCVEIIPHQWFIKDRSECFWPPNTYRKDKILKFIENCTDPMTNWKVFLVVLLGTYSDIKVAHRKAKKATICSDLSSNMENTLGTKRKRRPNPKYSTDESNDSSATEKNPRKKVRTHKNYNWSGSEQNTSSDDTEYPIIKKSLFTPRHSKSYSPGEENECETGMSRMCDNVLENPLIPNQKLTEKRPTKESPSAAIESTIVFSTPNSKKLTSVTSSTPKTCTSKSLQQTTDISNDVYRLESDQDERRKQFSPTLRGLESEREERRKNFSGALLNDNDFKKVMVEEISSLHLKTDMILQQIVALVKVHRTKEVASTTDYDVQVQTFNSKCPVNSIDQLKELEEWLKKESNYKLMVYELQRIGGNSYPQTIRKILYKILANQVSIEFSWDGAKKKEAFKKLKLPHGILEAMKKQYLDISEAQIIDIIKQWLVKAKERLNKEILNRENPGGEQ